MGLGLGKMGDIGGLRWSFGNLWTGKWMGGGEWGSDEQMFREYAPNGAIQVRGKVRVEARHRSVDCVP